MTWRKVSAIYLGLAYPILLAMEQLPRSNVQLAFTYGVLPILLVVAAYIAHWYWTGFLPAIWIFAALAIDGLTLVGVFHRPTDDWIPATYGALLLSVPCGILILATILIRDRKAIQPGKGELSAP